MAFLYLHVVGTLRMYLINIALARVEWSLGDRCIPAGLHWRQSRVPWSTWRCFSPWPHYTLRSLFYQKDTVRHQLDNVELVLEERMDCHKRMSFQDHSYLSEKIHHLSPLNFPQEVHIDKIVLKTISWNRVNSEYGIEVQWSDSTWTTMTKTHHELGDFLSKRSTEPFEKGLVRLLAQGYQYEPRDLERTLQEMLLSAPAAFRQRREVCRFLLPHCSHYNTAPPGKTCKAPEHFKEGCTEPSSQDHDIGSHHLRHQKACSSKRLGQRAH
uniref:zinc finger CCHC domain-containing protein 2-like isoform X3 n=1 Tax=Oncorhynchus gorbuscha TaxID=8017 RepID=UPI001EAF129E|nr:zinc finger CCHC domain-containing protein 2-like isoform X3 [Oncorhynchus gorbuscha]